MSTHTPEQPKSTPPVEVGHSGNLSGDMRETPVNFYTTPLKEAAEKHIRTPDNASSLVEEKKPKKREFTLVQKSLAGVAGLTILAGVAVGIGAAVNGERTQVSDPVTTSEPVGEEPAPEVTTEPTPEAITVESLSLSPDLLSDPTAFMETYLEGRITDWMNAGATPENAQIARDAGFGPETANRIAAEYDMIFIEALLVPGWESNPALVEWVGKITEIHANTLQLYYLTSAPDLNPDDVIPYSRGSVLDSILSTISNTDGSLTVQSSEHNIDNEKENTIGERGGTIGVYGDITTPTRTFVVNNGTVKLSDIILG